MISSNLRELRRALFLGVREECVGEGPGVALEALEDARGQRRRALLDERRRERDLIGGPG